MEDIFHSETTPFIPKVCKMLANQIGFIFKKNMYENEMNSSR